MQYLIEIKIGDVKASYWVDEAPDILDLETRYPQASITITPQE